MTQYNLPFNGAQINEAIEKARVHVVGLDTAPQQGSNKVVNSDGIYTAVNAKINTSDIVTEAQTIAANDVDTKVPSAAAVKDYVDNRGFGSGYSLLSTANSTTGTASASGFLLISFYAYHLSQTAVLGMTIGGTVFPSLYHRYGSSMLATIPITANESYDINISYGNNVKIYFKALS